MVVIQRVKKIDRLMQFLNYNRLNVGLEEEKNSCSMQEQDNPFHRY
jgi:hypothetical protein